MKLTPEKKINLLMNKIMDNMIEIKTIIHKNYLPKQEINSKFLDTPKKKNKKKQIKNNI